MVVAAQSPRGPVISLDGQGIESELSGIDSIMRVWAYVQDINKQAIYCSSYEYELCQYTAIGMLLYTQSALQAQRLHADEQERAYCLHIVSLLEQECMMLRLSMLQKQIVKKCFVRMYAALQ
jgi:head-tail adaptor